MLHRFLFLIVLALLLASPVLGQPAKGAKNESGGGLLMYGQDHLFAVKAPSNWTVDPTIGKKLGLHAVMYPKGSSWRDADATMYTNFVHKGSASAAIEKIIDDDIAGYKKDSPQLKVEDVDPLPLAAGKEKVIVKYFRNDKGGNFEAVAYIDESKVVILIVLSARTEKDFLSTLPLFKDLVHSYRFISDSVTFD